MPAKLIALQKELLMQCTDGDILNNLYVQLGSRPRELEVLESFEQYSHYF